MPRPPVPGGKWAVCRGVRVLKKPTIEEVGECLGLNRFDTGTVHDVVVAVGEGSVCVQLVHRVLAE